MGVSELRLWQVTHWETGKEWDHFRGDTPPFFPSILLGGFRISQVQLADSGVFTCVAASPAGVTDRNFTLQVHGTDRRAGLGGCWRISVSLALGCKHRDSVFDSFGCSFIHLTISC